jgi:hypothetical protein
MYDVAEGGLRTHFYFYTGITCPELPAATAMVIHHLLQLLQHR